MTNTQRVAFYYNNPLIFEHNQSRPNLKGVEEKNLPFEIGVFERAEELQNAALFLRVCEKVRVFIARIFHYFGSSRGWVSYYEKAGQLKISIILTHHVA